MIIETAGYLSGLAILMSFVPYTRDIFNRKTKPERMSWLIWAVLGSISFFSQMAKGASHSLWFVGVQFVGDFFVFILAIKYGFGGLLKRDIVALIGAVVGLGLWYITSEAAIALFIIIFIDATGVFLTVIKSYENPATETISAWVFTLIGGFLACIAVGRLNLILLAFPFYVFLASLAILISIKLGFRRAALR